MSRHSRLCKHRARPGNGPEPLWNQLTNGETPRPTLALLRAKISPTGKIVLFSAGGSKSEILAAGDDFRRPAKQYVLTLPGDNEVASRRDDADRAFGLP